VLKITIKKPTGGAGGPPPQPLEANGSFWAEPQTLQLFPKDNAFLSIFFTKFMLKIVFLNDYKVC